MQADVITALQEHGGVGSEFEMRVKFVGFTEIGEVELELPDGLRTYLPLGSFAKAADL